MENKFIQFYEEHGISPVHQDIKDYKLHLKRRSNLYRQLGIPLLAIRNAEILEIGAGGGV